MNDKQYLNELLSEIPKEDTRFLRLSMDVIERVHELLDKYELSQKDLAIKLGKSESEISKWLSVGHNLTLKSIAKLEIALDDLILLSPNRAKKQEREAFDSNGLNGVASKNTKEISSK